MIPAPLVACNGAAIPDFGLGTWRLRDAVAAEMTATSLRLGVRHIDTARMYENEVAVGRGIRGSGVPRDQIFVTSKIPPGALRADDVKREAEASLRDLDIGYLDLLLIHWPNASIPLKETLQAFAALKRRGLVRHIGVSNFTTKLIDQAVAASPEPLVTNQVEYHPYLDQSKVLAACRRHGMSLTAYSPLARGRIAEDPTIQAVARAHGRTPAQVALRWLVQQPDVIAIPRSSREARLAENFGIHDFALGPEEMTRISSLAHPQGRDTDPAGWAPAWD